MEFNKIYQGLISGNDLKNHKKILRKKNDNLEGGIGRFLTRIRIENEKEREKEAQKLSRNNINRKKAHKYLNLNRHRVIYPEKDTEVKKVNKKRTYGSHEKNLMHSTDGRITSLLKKTPLHFKYRGKKMMNNSVDYGKKKERRKK